MTDPHRLLAFLDDEIRSLRARIGGTGNATQRDRLAKLQDLRAYVATRERCPDNARAGA